MARQYVQPRAFSGNATETDAMVVLEHPMYAGVTNLYVALGL